MEREIYIRLARRICTVVFVLVLLLFFNAQVLAEGTMQDPNAVLSRTEEMPAAGVTEDGFSAVAVQLEAVARAEGRSMANQMLYDSFCAVSEISAGTYSAVPVSGNLNVIVVPDKNEDSGVAGWLLCLLAAVLVGSGIAGAALYNRRKLSGRRVVYKPMRAPTMHTSPYFEYRVQRTYR